MVKAKLAELALSQVGLWCYVFGGNGEDMTAMTDAEREAWICRRESDPANREKIRKLYAKRAEDGVMPIRGGDCSGFVYWCMKQLGLWKTDRKANTMYHDAIPIREPEPGDLAFRVDSSTGKATHVGVCIGNGEFVHSKGRDAGVVREKSKSTYWQAFGKIKDFEEDGLSGPPGPKKLYVRFLGSVRVREQPAIDSGTIKIMHKRQELPYLAEYTDARGNRWYGVRLNDTDVGYCSAFTAKAKKYTEITEK